MYEERRRILEMLASGKITSDEAEELMDALNSAKEKSNGETITEHTYEHRGDDSSRNRGQNPRFLRVMIAPMDGSKNSKQVNIRIPLAVIRAGVKLSSMLPEFARDKIDDAFDEKGLGINFSNLKPEQIDELMSAMRELDINITEKGDAIRIFCE
jgi:hypothetical protein